MNAFDQKKAVILADIRANSAETPDVSPKGTIDRRCLPIMNIINASPNMVTTSLCSGRVSVFLEGKKTAAQIGAKGNEGKWLFVTHEPSDLTHWHKSLDLCYTMQAELAPGLASPDVTRYVLFKFEPLILHVKCRDFASACLLFSTAMACGFRESGIGSNLVVGIRTLMKLDVPIAYLCDDKIMAIVSESYLELLTKLSADRFAENFRKLEKLEKAVASMQVPAHVTTESKEERRLRKIKEGMERRDSVRAQKVQKKADKLEKEELEAQT